jgi:zinc protease
VTGKPAAGILTAGLLATGLLAFAGADPAPKGNDPTPTTEERKVPRKTTATAKPGDEIAMELLPAPTSPLVTFRIQFRTGSIDDPEDLYGLSTLTALTLGEGGSKALTHRQVVDRLYPMAGSITVQPEREVVTFIGRVHRDHALRFYGLLSGLLLSPRFDEADFRRNRDLLIASIETGLRGNDDEELGKEALNGFLYLGHPYGHLVAGTVQGLRTITLEDVKQHYARQYTRQRVVFGLAGGYSADLLAAIREDFARFPSAGAARRPPLPAPPAIDGVEVLLIEKATPTAAISIGAPLSVTRAERDYYALMVANSWLGEHRTFNGRLMNVMRAARGLNYGDYSYVEWFIQDGGSTFPVANIPRRQQTFSIWIRPVARANAAFAVRQAVRELRRLVETGMTKEDFESTRAFLLNYSRLWTQSLDRRLGYLLDARFYGGAALVDRVQEELPRLTVADVNTALKERIDPARLRVAIVAEGTRDLARQLTSNGPTPIVYQTPTTDAALLAEDKEIEVYPLGIGPAGIRFYPATTMFEE